MKYRVVALLLWGVLWPGCTSSKTDGINQAQRAKVPVVVAVSGSAHRWTVPSSDHRNPTPSEDFLFFVWVKLSRMPADSVRAIAAMKFDEASPDRQGFAIALSQSGGGVRPEVYWKDALPRGGWYPFPELVVSPHRWTLLALSYRSAKFLGLHSLVRNVGGGRKVSELGGHLVSGPPPSIHKADNFRLSDLDILISGQGGSHGNYLGERAGRKYFRYFGGNRSESGARSFHT